MSTRNIMMLVVAVVAVIVVAVIAGNYRLSERAGTPAATSTAPATTPSQPNQ